MNNAADDPPSASTALLATNYPFLLGGGEMGVLIRRYNWQQSPIGSPEHWPVALRTLVGVMLNSQHPMFIAWGEQRTMLYNDSYATVCGKKHPAALGANFEHVWAEVMNDIGPILERAYQGVATHMSDITLMMRDRHGYLEETHFSFSYTPIRDETGEVAGMFCACTETTETVLSQRVAQLASLRRALLLDFGDRIRELADPLDIMAMAAETLGRHLQAGRVAYAEIDITNNLFSVQRDWTDGSLPSLTGSYRLEELGAELLQKYQAGSSVKLDSLESLSADTTTSTQVLWRRLGCQSLVGVPLKRSGQLRAVLHVQQAQPRSWRNDEVQLVEEFADRAFLAIERAYAEIEAHASEASERRALDAAHLGVYEWCAQGDRSFWGNARMYEIYGRTRADGPLSLTEFYAQALYPPDRVSFEKALRGTTPEAPNFRTTCRIRRRNDGALRWLEFTGQFEFDAQSRPQRLLGVVADITARKEAEAALRASRDELQLIADAVPVLLSFIDKDLIYRFANHSYAEWFGVPAAQIAGRSVLELLGPEAMAPLNPFMQRALAGEFLRFQVRVPYQGVGLRDIDAQYIPRRNSAGTVDGFYVFVQDITEREAAQRLLASQTQVLQRVVGGAPLPEVLQAISSTLEDQISGKVVVQLSTTQELSDPSLHDADDWVSQITASNGTGLGELRVKTLPVRTASSRERELLEVMARTAALAIERRADEQRLRESELRFRNLADNAPVMVWVTEADGTCSYLSRSWLEFTGTTLEQGLGFGWLQALHPDDRLRTEQAFLVANRSRQPWRGEYRLRRYDGEYRWAIDSAAPRFDPAGRYLGYVGSVLDITERKRIEQQLEQSAERLTLLWDSAKVLLAADEPERMLQTLFSMLSNSLAVDTYFNFSVEPSGGKLRLRSFAGVNTDQVRTKERLQFGEAICGKVAEARVPYTAEYIQQSDNPSYAVLRSYGLRAYVCSPMLAGGELIGTLSFGSRSRDWFTADELEFLGTVTRYVAVAYERLQLVQRLREADQRKDDFLATLAHELRNPLAPIRQATQILALPNAGERERQWSGGIIERQVNQMSLLLDDLLDVARITRDKLNLKTEPVVLSEVVNAAIETAQPLIKARQHQLEVSLPSQPLVLHADPLRLAQVISNLLTNAAKYTEPGGRIELSARVEQPSLVLSVKDNGIGLPTQGLAHIFDMFSQIGSALDRSQGGLGIGLALVRGLTQLHGGSVQAKSAGLGKGSEFIVHLPLPPQEAAVALHKEKASSLKPAKAKQRILVADDNTDAAETLATLLQMIGHNVAVAHDGETGFELAKTFQPTVCLLDIGMPRMNGYELAHRLQTEPLLPVKPLLVALTGWGQEADRQRALESGFDHHLTKPVDFERLQNILINATVPKPTA